MNRAQRFGPVVIATVRQAGGAPIVDGCSGTLRGEHEGDTWGGYAILPPQLWLRRRANRTPARALTVGATFVKSCPLPPSVVVRRRWHFLLVRLHLRQPLAPVAVAGEAQDAPPANVVEGAG